METCHCPVFGFFLNDKRDKYIPELNGFTLLIILIKVGNDLYKCLRFAMVCYGDFGIYLWCCEATVLPK